MLDFLDEIGISTLIIVVSALGWLLRKIGGSKLYNDQLREEMEAMTKAENEYSMRDKNNLQTGFTKFDVVLTGIGSNKIKVIKVIRSITGLGLNEAINMVESIPSMIKEGVSRDEAETIKMNLEEAGGFVGFK